MNKTIEYPKDANSSFYRYELMDLNKKLYSTLIKDLNNKYRKLIFEKKFNMGSFKEKMMKEIENFSFHKYPLYNKLFQKVERTFLKEISDIIEDDKNGLLTCDNVNNYFSDYNEDEFDPYKTYELPNISIRSILLNKNKFDSVDIYKNRKTPSIKYSKFDKMKEYNNEIKIKNNINKK